MKRIFWILFLLISSQTIAQSKKGEWLIGLYNDSWGGGLTSIYDDLRTFHFETTYQREDQFSLRGRYAFLTNRYDPDTLQRKALDEWVLLASIPVIRLHQGKISMIGGFSMLDNRVGAQIQETTHDIFGVTRTDLEYDDESGVFFNVGYAFEKTLFTRSLKQGVFQIQLAHSLEHTFNYQTQIKFASSFSLESDQSRMVFSSSFYLPFNHLNNALIDQVIEAESGLGLGLMIAGRRLFYQFQTFPIRRFSYGGVGILLNKANKTKSKGSKPFNLEVDMGVLNNGDGYNFKYAFNPFKLLGRETKVIINHNYQTLLSRYLPAHPTVNGHGNQVTSGLELELLKPKEKPRLFTPYANLSVGDRILSVYSQEIDLSSQTSHHLAVNHDLGTEVNVPLKFKNKTSRLVFSLYNRFTWLYSLTPGNESVLVNPDNSPYASIQHNLGMGIGIKI